MSIDPVSLAITVALSAAQMALNATRRIEGPRLEDLNVTVADYGTPLNYFYGKRRFNGVPIIWAEPIREEKKRRKTKGGKVNEYTYYGTWAIVVADHEIDAVTRVWFDRHLVYDATGAGPVSPFTLSKKKSIQDVMRVYLGSETQLPDPRMQATVEAEHGAGTCPAYRGVAYIVFEEVPLEKLGNRIPQISVEAVDSATAAYPYETVSTLIDCTQPVRLSPDFSRFFWRDGSDYEIWDTATRRRIIKGSFTGGGTGRGIASDGRIWGLRDVAGGFGDETLTVRDADGVSAAVNVWTFAAPVGFSDLLVIKSVVDDVEMACLQPYSNRLEIGWYDIKGVGGAVEETPDYQISSYFADLDGNIWGVGAYNGTTTLVFRRIYGSHGDLPDEWTVTAPSAESATIVDTQAFHYRDAEVDHFVVRWHGGDYFLAVDLATQAITIQVNTSGGSGYHMERTPAGSSRFWHGATEVNSKTLATIRAYSDTDLLTLWVNDGGTPTETWYDPVNHAIVTQPFADDKWTWRFLDRVTSAGVTLNSIVADVCNRCGIASGDRDTSDLTQTVLGWSWTQGSGKAIIEPLLDAYDSDCRPHDFKLQFLKRGATPAGTIEVGEFVAGQSRYAITRAQDTDLPRRITLSFADPDGEQQPNSVVTQRPLDIVDGIREVAVDLTTLVLDIDEARQIAERYFRRIWNEREAYTHGLTTQRMALEPADVWNLKFDDMTRSARLIKLTFAADDSLKLEWKQDFPSLAGVVTTPGAPQDGRVPSVIIIPTPSRALILDIPTIKDSDNRVNPLLYYGAGPYGTGLFSGASIVQYDGTDYDLEVAGVASDSGATWGYTTNALTSAASTVWSRGSSVNVRLNHGTLVAVTEAACNANSRLNLAAIGAAGRWELVQFTTPVLQGDGTWTITGFKHGRRGTEWAIGTHATGDTFILMDNLAALEMGAGDIGNDLSFKAVTLGTDVESAIPTDVDDYTAASNRPWAPAQFEAIKDPSSGDWAFTWRRRSRIAGDFAPYDPPLGESAENYEVKIYRSGFGAAATRTIAATSETASYTNAQQITDGGAVAVGDLDAGVLQVGDLADGYETQVSF